MKRFATITSLLAIALNCAMGYTGGVLFCEHETGDSHIVSKVEHANENHHEDCHSVDPIDTAAHIDEENCDPCTDTEFVAEETSKAAPNSKSERGSNGQTVSTQATNFEFEGLGESLATGKLPLSRAPPSIKSLTELQVEVTELRI